jgi:hypothetical protein
VAIVTATARGPRIQVLRVFLLLLGTIALLVVLPLILTFSLYTVRYMRYTREEMARGALLGVASARKATEMYQGTITQAATLVLMDPALGEIEAIRSLNDVHGSFDTHRKLDRAVSLLTSMTYVSSLRIESAYFHVDGT